MKEMKITLIGFMITTIGAFVTPPLLEPNNQYLAFNPLYIQNTNLNGTNKPPDIISSGPTGSHSSHRTFLEFPRSKYVDKTGFILEALGLNISFPVSAKRPSILITRPRGFGKTLALSSLYYFCDYSFKNATGLFSGLNIMSKPCWERTRSIVIDRYMNKFPVIWIDFGTVKYETLEQNFKEVKRIISNIFRGHQYLLESYKLSLSTTKRFQKLVGEPEEYSSIKSSIQFLGECIHEYNNRLPIVLIDNYDVPFHTGYKYNYYKEIEEFMWSFYYHTIQENRFVHMVVLTGVTQIHDSSFYILENMHVCTILDKTFSGQFGFTAYEVERLKLRSSSSSRITPVETLEHQYGGYLCGEDRLFHPSSVVNEIFSHNSYAWAKAEPKDFGRVILEHGLYPLLTIQTLVDGRSVEKHLAKHIHFPDLKNREISYWSFLLHSGYVTATRIAVEFPSSKFRLNIPNLEVGQKIQSFIKEAAKTIPDYKKFTDQLILGDYAHAQYFVYNYTRDAGNYFWAERSHFFSKLRGYVELMLRGVENRVGTATNTDYSDRIIIEPKREEAGPIVVTIQLHHRIDDVAAARHIIEDEFTYKCKGFFVGNRTIEIYHELVILVTSSETVYIYGGADILFLPGPSGENNNK